MRQTAIATSALVTAIVAIWGVSVLTAKPATRATTDPASAWIDVMQMMKDAKNLPDQRYDAY